MTLPLRYIENQFVKLSRGTLNGLPLLMPGKNDELCNQILAIILRDACRFNITILALNVEPCGYEMVIFDPQMRRSEFLKAVNQGISMKVKKSIDHRESVWSNRKPGNVPILDLETLENEIVEVCVSPVRKGYVESVDQWVLPQFGPIGWSEEDEIHEQSEDDLPKMKEADIANFALPDVTQNRGRGSFERAGNSKTGPMAPVFARLISSKSSLIERISGIETAEKERREELGEVVFGCKACRKKASFLTVSAENRRDHNEPKTTVLCTSKERLNQAITCLKSYYYAYRMALVAFNKSRDAVFPGGVLKMRTLFGVAFSSVENDDVFHFAMPES